ncbi:MAG: hypothetical protein CMP48_24750 [Rickettsiales bacterium]|nr:hypothetical protein [Rickettsiales bacterium]
MKRLVFVVLVLHSFTVCMAQKTIEVAVGDQINLSTSFLSSDVIWESSIDMESFTDLPTTNGELVIIAEVLPLYIRARLLSSTCDEEIVSELITLVEKVDGLLWSDPDTWGGTKPVSGDEVTIQEGLTVILDENSPDLGGLTIKGALLFDEKDIELTSEWIVVEGLLQVGSKDKPFSSRATITLTDADQDYRSESYGTRGIVVLNGAKLELHGKSPEVLWTKLNEHADKGSKTISLVDSPDWKTGDEVAIAPTDYYHAGNGSSVTQLNVVDQINDQSIQLIDELNAFRWGLLQYATENGMSLSNTGLLTPPLPDTEERKTPLVLDERAEVVHLTRNITIQSIDDDLWKNQGFGAHTMIMPGAEARVDGVTFKWVGQRGRLRRYPMHWHNLSYSGSSTLDDVTDQYIKNSVVQHSANRGIVIHGTNGLVIQNNVLFDIQGHGVFTEDAVERRNTIDGNIVMKVRNPPYGTELKQHEQGEFGSSGFWISNPDNYLTSNRAIDCQTFGMWLAFTTRPWGDNSSVLAEDGLLLNPSRTLFGVFDGNVTHSNLRRGIMLDLVEIDNEGNTGGHQYYSTIDGRDPSYPFETLRRFTLSRYETWKNGGNGIWDRATWPDNYEIVSADNCGRYFAGAGADGLIERALVVGTSLNYGMNGTGREALGYADFYADDPGLIPVAFATYHSTFDIHNNIIIDFPLVPGKRSGAFATEDYYIRPIEKGTSRNTGNLLVNAHAGYKIKSWYGYFTLASALWDPDGLRGPAGNYIVYDDPFLTYGKVDETTDGYSAADAGGISVSGPFYGFRGFVLHGIGDNAPQNQPYRDLMEIHVQRLDQDLNEVATWSVDAAQSGAALDHMRDFATVPEAIYQLTFPGSELPTDYQMYVENMLEEEDTQVIGISFDGSITPTVRMFAYQYNEQYEHLNSLNDVIQSSGATWFQDTDNNLVWVKIRGGFWRYWTDDTSQSVPSSDDLLYETMELRIRPE